MSPRSPQGKYHFELGRALAEHLGYPADVLDRIPTGAIESFAGVGYFFDLAELSEGERVIDLGSGSGMDVFFAANRVGAVGQPSSASTSPPSSSRRHGASPRRPATRRSSSARAASSSCPLTRGASTA